jgi:hypothetical protein
MTAWRQAIAFSFGTEDLVWIAPSRTEPASRAERAQILLAYLFDYRPAARNARCAAFCLDSFYNFSLGASTASAFGLPGDSAASRACRMRRITSAPVSPRGLLASAWMSRLAERASNPNAVYHVLDRRTAS